MGRVVYRGTRSSVSQVSTHKTIANITLWTGFMALLSRAVRPRLEGRVPTATFGLDGAGEGGGGRSL